MSREMIVGGRTYLTGATHSSDYDELMEMGAEPAPPEMHPAPPHLQQHHHHHHNGHPAPPHMQHPGAPMMMHPGHHPAPPHMEHGFPHPGHGHGHEHHGVHVERAGGSRMRIIKEEPKHSRQFPIGFQMDAVAPGDEEDIEVKPQVLFRGERLAIAQSIARYFDVLDIKVGKDSQLAATGNLTGEAFETRAVGVRMELDTAEPGIVITLRIKNVDTAQHDFKAVLYGAVLE